MSGPSNLVCVHLYHPASAGFFMGLVLQDFQMDFFALSKKRGLGESVDDPIAVKGKYLAKEPPHVGCCTYQI